MLQNSLHLIGKYVEYPYLKRIQPVERYHVVEKMKMLLGLTSYIYSPKRSLFLALSSSHETFHFSAFYLLPPFLRFLPFLRTPWKILNTSPSKGASPLLFSQRTLSCSLNLCFLSCYHSPLTTFNKVLFILHRKLCNSFIQQIGDEMLLQMQAKGPYHVKSYVFYYDDFVGQIVFHV